MDDNKQKALSAALSQIERQFGKGSVMRLGDQPISGVEDAIPTGSLGLDIALGIGGLPRGRIIEIYGPESSGKTTLTLQVIDATAGFGSDAAVLAHLGCQVQMIERSPILCALLQDGLDRAIQAGIEFSSRLTLVCIDAKCFLSSLVEEGRQVDIVYLDPMFPVRSKTALAKKEMRILKQLVGTDQDASMLFSLAKKCARKRVVVKRPKLAPTLVEQPASVVFQAKACRFDVYI